MSTSIVPSCGSGRVYPWYFVKEGPVDSEARSRADLLVVETLRVSRPESPSSVPKVKTKTVCGWPELKETTRVLFLFSTEILEDGPTGDSGTRDRTTRREPKLLSNT